MGAATKLEVKIAEWDDQETHWKVKLVTMVGVGDRKVHFHQLQVHSWMMLRVQEVN